MNALVIRAATTRKEIRHIIFIRQLAHEDEKDAQQLFEFLQETMPASTYEHLFKLIIKKSSMELLLYAYTHMLNVFQGKHDEQGN